MLEFTVYYQLMVIYVNFVEHQYQMAEGLNNKCVSGNGSENFRHTFFFNIFFLEKNI